MGTLALLAVLLTCLLAFLRYLLPFAAFPYELDPGDGDMVNAARRWDLGLPLYGDWHSGDINIIYTPLFLLIMRVGRFLNADPIVFLRHVDLGLFVGILLVLVRVAGQQENGRWNPTRGLLAGVLLFSAWRGYLWMMPVRPDMLALFLSVLACTLLVMRPRSAVGVAVLGVLAVLSKQYTLVVPTAGVLAYGLWHRQHLRRYLLALLAAAAIAILYFEIQSHGHFFRGAFLNPPRTLSGRFLRWDRVLDNAKVYYARNLWLVPLVITGFVAALRSPLRALALTFAVDLALEVSITRNVTGSPTYLWLHFSLAAVLAAYGWWRLLLFAASRLPALARPGVCAGLSALLALGWFASDGRRLVTLHVPDPTKAKAINVAHETVVREVVATHPGARWIATRSSLALVKAGVVLDKEYCTLAIATATPEGIDPRPIQRSVARGEYQLAQVAPTGIASDPLTDVFRDCYRVLRTSSILYLSNVVPASILEYQGDSPACRRLQE